MSKLSFTLQLWIVYLWLALFLMIGFKVLLAVAVAVRGKEFDPAVLPEYLLADGLPMLLLAVAGGLAMITWTDEQVGQLLAQGGFVAIYTTGVYSMGRAAIARIGLHWYALTGGQLEPPPKPE